MSSVSNFFPLLLFIRSDAFSLRVLMRLAAKAMVMVEHRTQMSRYSFVKSMRHSSSSSSSRSKLRRSITIPRPHCESSNRPIMSAGESVSLIDAIGCGQGGSTVEKGWEVRSYKLNTENVGPGVSSPFTASLL